MSTAVSRRRPGGVRFARHQRGVTLIIALIMLVVIGLASAAVMRGSLTSDTMANNARVQMLASQAAQLALRFCETQVERKPADWVSGFSIQAATAVGAAHNWESYTNWESGGKAMTVPSSVMASAKSTFTPSTLPQCLAEYSNDVTGAKAVIVTARGFSPDYAETSGRQTAGSVVWLQSTLSIQ